MFRLICLVLVLGLAGCASQGPVKSTQEKQADSVEKKVEEKRVEEKAVVKDKKEEAAFKQMDVFETKLPDYNKELEKSSIEQFKLGSSEIPQKQWDHWAKKAAPIVRDLINIMPRDYVLEIRGHADVIGTDSANAKLSEKRAFAVYQALLKQGIQADKMVYRGLGSSELIPSVKDTDSRQRRVSFKVVKK